MRDPEILRGTYEDILYRDCITRWKIRDFPGFIHLARFLLTNIGNEVSYRSLATTLGIKSVTTVREYIQNLASTYLIFEVYRYDPSLKKQYGSGKKIYAIDTGMRNQVSFRFSGDHGKLLENLVFLELKRRRNEIFYHSSTRECDLLTIQNGRVTGLFQVCYELNSQNRVREYEGLQEAMNQYGLELGNIITLNQEEQVQVPEGIIQVIPVWKWFLNSEA